MPKHNLIDPDTQLSPRQRNLLFAIVKEYCDFGQSVGSKELKDKYGFHFSSATIRNELARLRELDYLFQPFLNSSSKPTEKAFKLFISQLILGLQVTTKQQQELKKQIVEMEQKQGNLSKEISKLLAFQTGGVAFSVNQDIENISGMKNLLEAPADGKVSDILEFLDNLDSYKQFLLAGEVSSSKAGPAQSIHAVIGGENPVLPLGRGYAMVTTEVFLQGQEKSVVGLITPIHLLAKEKNLELLEALSKVLRKNELD
jgi:heat-inducible transcriptional repressor